LFDRYTTSTLKDALSLLRRANELISVPSRWTREVWARDEYGGEVPAANRGAVSWCIGGAVIRAQSELFSGKGTVEIRVSQGTDDAVAVRGPKRVVVALELLGRYLLEANQERIDVNAAAATPGAPRLADQHPTLVASDINDLIQIEHPHVLLGVASAMVALSDELATRAIRVARQRRSETDPTLAARSKEQEQE
jgi:hypothetical protein